jgi:hypothetical protein
MAVLVDTGILYALADGDDDWHGTARAWLDGVRDLLLVPVTVVPEVTYLLHTRLGAAVERRFVGSLVRGEIAMEPLAAADLGRAGEVLDLHPEIGFVDATVVAVAERLGIRRLATTDRRHFGRVRPRHAAAFELLP